MSKQTHDAVSFFLLLLQQLLRAISKPVLGRAGLTAVKIWGSAVVVPRCSATWELPYDSGHWGKPGA